MMKYLMQRLSFLVVLLLPVTAPAQEMLLAPSEWDFGDVQIGDTQTVEFHAVSLVDDDLRVFLVEFLEGEDSDFSTPLWTEYESWGDPIQQGSSQVFFISFAPTTLGWHSAWATVVSNDGTNPISGVAVSGRGVAAASVPEPATSLLLFTSLIGLAAAGRKNKKRT
jgi:hypothetical protein